MTKNKPLNNSDNDLIAERILYRILTMYYIEEQNQSQIAKHLGLSTAKVNRLIKQARAQGLVEINVRMPSQHLFDLEATIGRYSGVMETVVVPELSDNAETALRAVGQAAANYLLENLIDGDTICISGGKTMHAIVQHIESSRRYDVQVVPATGARQGRYYTDVNNLAAMLAEKLGGKAYQIHAPVLVDKPEDRDVLMALRQISDILEMARSARIALFSVGSMIPNVSSYFDLMSAELLGSDWETGFENAGTVGEVLAYVYDSDGQLCMPEFNDLVIGLTLEELKSVPLTIAVAATTEKTLPIYGALQGNYLKTLITDERTARAVIDLYQQNNAYVKD